LIKSKISVLTYFRDDHSAEEWKELGNEKYKSSSFSEACDLYSKAIELEPRVAKYYGNRSAALFSMRSYEKCLQDCTTAFNLDPKGMLKCAVRGAKCLTALGQFDKAISLARDALLNDPRLETALAEKAQAERAKKLLSTSKEQINLCKWNEAAKTVSQLEQITGAPNFVQRLRAEVLVGQGKGQEAMPLCNSLIQTNSHDPEILYIRGKALYLTSNFAMAIKHFAEALRSDPDFAKAKNMLKLVKKMESTKASANEAFKNREYLLAIEKYTECLTLDPQHKGMNAILFCNRAAALTSISKDEEALEDCNRAISLDESYTKAFIRRAKINMKLEKYEEAVRDYEKLAREDPSSREMQQELRNAKLELKKSKRKNYYKILGVEKNAGENEIRRAYKKMALKWHPDKHQGDDKEEAEKNFKDVNEAFSVLSDRQKKEQYDSGVDLQDMGGMGGMGGMDGADMMDIFSMFMGGGMGGMGGMGGGRRRGRGGFSFH